MGQSQIEHELRAMLSTHYTTDGLTLKMMALHWLAPLPVRPSACMCVYVCPGGRLDRIWPRSRTRHITSRL